MENKLIQDTNISFKVLFTLEDDLDDGIIPQSKCYKEICKYIPQDFLDNFLAWYGQEAIERYVKEIKQVE